MKTNSDIEDTRKCFLFFETIDRENCFYFDDATNIMLEKLNYSIPTFNCYNNLYKIFNKHDLDNLFPTILLNAGEEYVSSILNNIFHLYEFFDTPEKYFNKELYNYFLSNEELLLPPRLMLSEVCYYAENIEEFSSFEMKRIYSLINLAYYDEKYKHNRDEQFEVIEEMCLGLFKKFPNQFFKQAHPFYIEKHLINSSVHDIKKFNLSLDNLFQSYEKSLFLITNNTKGAFICPEVWNYLIKNFQPNDDCFMDNYHASLFTHFIGNLSWQKGAVKNILNILTDENQKKIYSSISFEEIVNCFYRRNIANKFLFDSESFIEILKNYPNVHFDINDEHNFLKKILTNPEIHTTCANVIKSMSFYVEKNQTEFAVYYGKCIFENLQKNPDKNMLWNGLPKNLQSKEIEKLETAILKSSFIPEKKTVKKIL